MNNKIVFTVIIILLLSIVLTGCDMEFRINNKNVSTNLSIPESEIEAFFSDSNFDYKDTNKERLLQRYIDTLVHSIDVDVKSAKLRKGIYNIKLDISMSNDQAEDIAEYGFAQGTFIDIFEAASDNEWEIALEDLIKAQEYNISQDSNKFIKENDITDLNKDYTSFLQKPNASHPLSKSSQLSKGLYVLDKKGNVLNEKQIRRIITRTNLKDYDAIYVGFAPNETIWKSKKPIELIITPHEHDIEFHSNKSVELQDGVSAIIVYGNSSSYMSAIIAIAILALAAAAYFVYNRYFKKSSQYKY